MYFIVFAMGKALSKLWKLTDLKAVNHPANSGGLQ